MRDLGEVGSWTEALDKRANELRKDGKLDAICISTASQYRATYQWDVKHGFVYIDELLQKLPPGGRTDSLALQVLREAAITNYGQANRIRLEHCSGVDTKRNESKERWFLWLIIPGSASTHPASMSMN
jgi:hypothetical protein